MPYILLIFGIGLAGFALYKFLIRAEKKQAQKCLLSLAICIVMIMIFTMIMIGRLPIAALLALLLIPLLSKLYSVFHKE